MEANIKQYDCRLRLGAVWSSWNTPTELGYGERYIRYCAHRYMLGMYMFKSNFDIEMDTWVLVVGYKTKYSGVSFKYWYYHIEMDTWMLVLGDKAEISWCSVFQISEGQRAGKKERAKKKTRRRYHKRKQVLIKKKY